MKSISKFFVATVAGFMLMFTPTHCAKASLIGDAALLAQQVAQFLNDFSFDNAKWADFANKFKQLGKIVKVISNGSQAYSTMRSIEKSVKLITSTGEDCYRFISYLEKYSTNFRVDRAYNIYNGFNRLSSSLYSDISKTLTSFLDLTKQSGSQSSTGFSPLEYVKAVDEVLAEFSGSLVESVDETKLALVDMCVKTSVDNSCSDNADFFETKWF